MNHNKAIKRLKELLLEAKQTLGMVNEMKAKIRLYQSIQDEAMLEKLKQGGNTEAKMLEDLNRYWQVFKDIEQETKKILARINGEV